MDELNFSYLSRNWRTVLAMAVDHLELSVTAVALALVVALPLGLIATRYRPLTLPILGLLGALYTVPSLAFLTFLIPTPVGIGRDNALVALTTYAQLFLVRNIVAGLRGVSPAALEAATGLGMTPAQVFFRVRWPLALPVVLAGVRTALVTTISLATIAGWIDAGGLGPLLFNGIARDRPPMILAGAVASVALALLTDALLRLAERLTAVSRARRAAG